MVFTSSESPRCCLQMACFVFEPDGLYLMNDHNDHQMLYGSILRGQCDSVNSTTGSPCCLFFIYSAVFPSFLTFTVDSDFLFLVGSINFCNLSHPLSLGKGIGEQSLDLSSKFSISLHPSLCSVISPVLTDQTS